jgi:Xaa-Pro aminopeptidase
MSTRPDTDAVLIIADSESDADMLYASGLFAPDAYTYIEQNGKKTILMSDLEIDRARAQSKVDEVLSLTEYTTRAEDRSSERPEFMDAVSELLNEKQIQVLRVPNRFPTGYADQLRERGFTVKAKADPFWDRRPMKTGDEVAAISEASRHTESAIRAAMAVVSEATVKEGLLQGPEGPLTSEYIKRLLHIHLLERDCIAQHTIVAGGLQGCDPHDAGSGPLPADRPIIMDVFPKSMKTGYFADITRTVIKGPAPDVFKRMYDTVLEAQDLVFSRLKAGIDGKEIHEAVENLFISKGYETGEQNGRMQGFFHGTGHGFGLEIHEPPRISKNTDILQVGHIVTNEPGLYYPELGGGIRIEDNALVTEDGYVNLTQLEKVFEV